MLSRGVRNCNPGNIRRTASPFRGEVVPGDDPQFKQFESMAWGYRAMMLIIHNYNELYGINTLSRIIARWAPPSENHTSNYIRAVARRLGVTMKSHIDTKSETMMKGLVSSMSWVENGVPAVAEDVDEGWRLFIEGQGGV